MKKIWHLWERNEQQFYSTSPKSSTKYISLIENKDDLVKQLNDLNGKIERIYFEAGVAEILETSTIFDLDEDVPSNETGIELPAGCYRLVEDRYQSPPIKLIPFDIRDDAYIRDEKLYDKVTKELKMFRENESIYRETKTLYKRSVLMYGAPGHGKSALIRDVINSNLKEDAVVIFFDSAPSLNFIKAVAVSLAGREKLFIFEELLQVLESFSGTQSFLEFMDGERSLDGAFIIGTTNYPEKLPENMTDRPSRWDSLVKVDDSTLSNQTQVLTHFLGRDPSKEESVAVKGMSAAYIKELCFMMRLHNFELKDALKIINDRKKLVKNDFVERKQDGIGFGARGV